MRLIAKATIAGALAMTVSGCGGSGSQPTAPESTSASGAPSGAASGAGMGGGMGSGMGGGMSAAGAGSAAAGAAQAPAEFAQCQVCHSTEAGKNMVGPSLAGVYGRKSGTEPGFNYSENFKKLHVTWDEAHLDKWLTNPMEMVPGTMMAFPGIRDDARRKAVIEYLETLK